jgi:hypothetical protein
MVWQVQRLGVLVHAYLTTGKANALPYVTYIPSVQLQWPVTLLCLHVLKRVSISRIESSRRFLAAVAVASNTASAFYNACSATPGADLADCNVE